MLLLHIILFDRSYNLTYWLNYGEVKAALRRRYASPNSSERDLYPSVMSDLDWRLNFSPTGLDSTYGARKNANPTSRPLFSSPLNEVPFAPGTGAGDGLGQGRVLYFNPILNDQGPKGLTLSLLSSENGATSLLPTRGQTSAPSSSLTGEVMQGYM